MLRKSPGPQPSAVTQPPSAAPRNSASRASSLPLRLKFTLWSLVVFLIVYLATSGTWFIAQNALATSTREKRLQSEAMGIADRVVREAHGQIDAELPRRIHEELERTDDFARAQVLLRAADGAIEARVGDAALERIEVPLPSAAQPDAITRDRKSVV